MIFDHAFWSKSVANTKYYRLMLGKAAAMQSNVLQNVSLVPDYGIERDLSRELPDCWLQFNAKFIPVYQEVHPGKTKVAAGLACGMPWTVVYFYVRLPTWHRIKLKIRKACQSSILWIRSVQ